MLVKFSSLGGGVFIEVRPNQDNYTDDCRCFRFGQVGEIEYTEYALYRDLADNGPERARWYGHQFRRDNFTFA